MALARPIALVIASLAFPTLSSAETPISAFQVYLGPPPTTVVEAAKTRGAREKEALAATACGTEEAFLAEIKEDEADEDIVKRLVAKVAWLTLHGADLGCTFAVDIAPSITPATPTTPKVEIHFDTAAFNKDYVSYFGAQCAAPITLASVQAASPIEKREGIDENHTHARVFVSNQCLIRQINMAISEMDVFGQPGSSKIPCDLLDKVEGEWDVVVRDLVRVYYLSRSPTAGSGDRILEAATEKHLFEELLTLDGAPGPDSYPLTGCGNTEVSTGSPADRADERSWGEDAFDWLGDAWDAFWDVFKWILLAILIIIAIVATILTLGAALPVWAAAIATTAATVAVVGIVAAVVLLIIAALVRIPETENHLLMINTSRYLTNQIIIDANPTDVDFFVDDQKEVKEWLLRRMRRITTEDFEEYNARPYQRYSIIAILNLHDFVRCDPQRGAGGDCDLKTAATIVLDLATAKFAGGSNQSRRIAPFRRLLEVVEDDIGDKKRLIEALSAADYMVSFMMVYSGATHQLPGYKADYGAAAEMIYPATSRYTPAPAVMSIALGEKGAFEQRFRHDGLEIYSSTPRFLVSAGGVRTPSATPMKLLGVSIGENCNDRGAALPTVLIPSGRGYGLHGSAHVLRDDFLRIEGFYYFYTREGAFDCIAPLLTGLSGPPAIPQHKLDRDHSWSHDDNACVHRGFACGTNIVVPPALKPCFVKDDGSPWAFLSSGDCLALPNTPLFYVALYTKPCPPEAENCLNNWGFFHAIEAPDAADPAAAFAKFRARVLELNSPLLIPDPPAGDDPHLAGIYVTPDLWSKSDRIAFDAAGTANDEDQPGVDEVNGVAQMHHDNWPLAFGDLINANMCPFPWGQGLIEISGHQKGVTIDFCDWATPKRVDH